MQKIDRKITWYYENKDILEPSDRFLMNRNLTQVFKKEQKRKESFSEKT